MNKKTDVIEKTDNPISKYREISGFVWDFFKKYLPTDADLTNLVNDIGWFDEKYMGTDEYDFMQKLLKVYFDELNRIKRANNEGISQS